MAQSGAEAKPYSEGRRERIRQATMNDDAGQQRLHAAEHRVAPAGGQQAVATRVEAALEGPDEELTEAPAARSARNVRPRTAETSSRMEDVLPSRKRGSEEVARPRLTPADTPQMGISEMAVILTSLGMAPVNFQVAELFCRNRFGDAAVDAGFELGIIVYCATGWNMKDEEQMEEVEQRVRDEESVLSDGSPMSGPPAPRLNLRRSQAD